MAHATYLAWPWRKGALTVRIGTGGRVRHWLCAWELWHVSSFLSQDSSTQYVSQGCDQSVENRARREPL